MLENPGGSIVLFAVFFLALAAGCSDEPEVVAGTGGSATTSVSTTVTSGAGTPTIKPQELGAASKPACVLRLGASKDAPDVVESSFMKQLALDAAGNALLAGEFYGDLELPNGVLTSAGGWDIAVMKVDPSCSVLWAKRFGSSKDQFINDVAATPEGGLVLVGPFENEIDFGEGPLAASLDGSDVYVAKLDEDGEPVWADHLGEGVGSTATGVVVNPSGQIFITGTLGKGGFLLSLDPAGHPLWSHGLGLDVMHGDVVPTALAMDPGGDVLAGGRYSGEGVDIGGVSLPPADAYVDQGFVTRFSATGEHVSSAAFVASEGEAAVVSMAADAAGGVLVAGRFRGAVSVADLTLDDPFASLPEDSIFHVNVRPTFVAKLDASWTAQWLKFSGEAGQLCGGPSAAFTPTGDVLVTGCFSGTLDFGGGELEVHPTYGEQLVGGAFVAKLDTTGQHLQSRVFGPDAAAGWSVAATPAGDVALLGGFLGKLQFGARSLDALSYPDAFFTWLSP